MTKGLSSKARPNSRGAILLFALLAVAVTATFLSGAAVLTRRIREDTARFYAKARLGAALREVACVILRSRNLLPAGTETTPDGIRISWTLTTRATPTGRSGEFRAVADQGTMRRECLAFLQQDVGEEIRIRVWLER